MPSLPSPEGLDVPALLRAARRAADLSQRELAVRAQISQASIASYESATRGVDVAVLQRLLQACGWHLLVVDAAGLPVLASDDERRDRGLRRYPAHLDVRRTGGYGDWWGDYYPMVWGVPPRPDWTFHVDRRRRDERRREVVAETARSADGQCLGSAAMDDAELLAAFDAQIRRRAEHEPGYEIELVEEPAPMLRMWPTSEGATWGGGVFWCDLDESNADSAIRAAVEWFRPLGHEWEWKHYGYDRPADLPDRLRAAGFEPDEQEALVIGEVEQVRASLAGAPEPGGITIRRLREDDEGRAADWAAIGELHRAVWDEDPTGYVASLSAAHAADPHGMSVWLAVAPDGLVVCASRANFHAGTDFVSLWGGSTLEAYRGRGIYKALVSRRADEAAERGFRFLQVDASPDSRPILERLGLRTLTSTTPWMWRPTP